LLSISPMRPSALLLYLLFSFFFSYRPRPHRALHSFPTRRSSDLPAYSSRPGKAGLPGIRVIRFYVAADPVKELKEGRLDVEPALDRKSTRLNSSHEWISYAVFCLKKKKTKNNKRKPQQSIELRAR